MKKRWMGCIVVGGIAIASLPLAAHHAFDAEYDRQKERDFKGTITKVEWLNPHARAHLDVKDAGGKVTNWEFELGSPNVLMRQGWSRYTLKTGDHVTIHANLAKDGSNLANARTIILADGRKVSAGSSADGDSK